MRRKTRRWPLLLSALMTLGACTPDFEAVEKVKDLRFLSIAAEPPEQLLWETPALPPEVAAWLLGALGEGDFNALCRSDGPKPPAMIPGMVPVRITPLIVDPRVPEAERGTRSFRYEIWGCSAKDASCAASDGYRVKLKEGSAPLDKLAFDFLPDGELFRFALCEDSFLGFGGLPIMAELRVYDEAEERWVIGTKRVAYTFWLPYSPIPAGKKANTNPEFDSVVLRVKDKGKDGAEDTVVRELKLADLNGAALELRRDQLLEIEPVLTEASKESYVQVGREENTTGTSGLKEFELEECDKGEQRSTDEDVQCGVYFSWDFFATEGSLSHSVTGGSPGLVGENKKVKDPTSVWTPPQITDDEPSPASSARLWIVGSDGRGGSMWRSLDVNVSEVP